MLEMGVLVITLPFEYRMKSDDSFWSIVRFLGVFVSSNFTFIGFTVPSFITNFSCENTETGGYASSFEAKI